MPVGALQRKTHLEIETPLCFAACWDEVLPGMWFYEVTQIIYTHVYIYIYHTHTYIHVHNCYRGAASIRAAASGRSLTRVMLSLKGVLHLQGRAPSTLLSHHTSAGGANLSWRHAQK